MSRAAFGSHRHDNQPDQPNALSHQDPSLLGELKVSKYDPASPSAMTERTYTADHGIQDAESRQDKPRLTIRQLRQAAQKEALTKELAQGNQKSQDNQPNTVAAPQKKKPSLFGGLFQVREPTQIALNQVTAQMIAQHGSTSATKVPNVRLEKMPDFVPKVNSKWDGIPQNIKQKEKKLNDKEKQKGNHESFFIGGSKSDSDDVSRRRTSRNSSSTADSSFGAYGNSSGSQGASSRTRFYAQSFNSSGDLASQQRTESQFPHSLTSWPEKESGSAKPRHPERRPSSAGTEEHSRCQEDSELDPPKSSATNRSYDTRLTSTKLYGVNANNVPPKSSATDRPSGNRTSSANKAVPWESIDWAQASRVYGTPNARVVSQHSASLTPSSQHPSPVTSSPSEAFGSRPPANETSSQTALLSPGPAITDASASRRKKSRTQCTDAFLAGEAKELVLLEESSSNGEADFPIRAQNSGQKTADSGRSRIQQDLEKRPDSSRDRLGLRASMLFTDEMTPWEKQKNAQPPPPSPRIDQHAINTKTRFPKPFGKFGK